MFFVTVLIGCGRAGSDGASESAPVTVAATIESGAIPGIQALADSAGLEGLLVLLGTTTGSFTRAPSGKVIFDGDERLFPAFSHFGDAAVYRLVACLDDTSRVAATRAGGQVMMGIMCSSALYRIAYSAQFETEPDWPGIVLEDATAEELRAARRAWEPVVAAKAYLMP